MKLDQIMSIDDNMYFLDETDGDNIYLININENRIEKIEDTMGYCGELFNQLMECNIDDFKVYNESLSKRCFVYEFGILDDMNEAPGISAILKLFKAIPSLTLSEFNEILDNMGFCKI